MELGLFSKMKIILQMLFSSFMSIELVLFFLLFLLLLIFNIKIKNKIVPMVLSVFSIVGILSFVLYFPSYTLTCIDSFIMKVMDYYYFPSTVVYFFIVVFMIIVCIFTMFSRNMGNIKKGFNYCCSTFVFLLFSMFISLIIQGSLDMADPVALYQNKQILSIVQLSNLVVLFWFIVSFFYNLYLFFRRKFDNKKVEII